MPSLKGFVSAALLCLAFICCLGAPAKADEILSAIRFGANEVPANSSAGVGGVILVLFGNNLEVSGSFSGLSNYCYRRKSVLLRGCRVERHRHYGDRRFSVRGH
jgi:hypothetical protein